MLIYRVVISFMREHMTYMHERAALAMNPGEAVNMLITNLDIPIRSVQALKCWVNCPDSLEDFSRDALMLAVLGTDLDINTLWKRKHGDSV